MAFDFIARCVSVQCLGESNLCQFSQRHGYCSRRFILLVTLALILKWNDYSHARKFIKVFSVYVNHYLCKIK